MRPSLEQMIRNVLTQIQNKPGLLKMLYLGFDPQELSAADLAAAATVLQDDLAGERYTITHPDIEDHAANLTADGT